MATNKYCSECKQTRTFIEKENYFACPFCKHRLIKGNTKKKKGKRQKAPADSPKNRMEKKKNAETDFN